MKNILFTFFIFSSIWLFAQKTDTLTLDGCNRLAKQNYPLIKQKKLLSDATEINIRNLNKNWLPQIYLNAQATYQSDVTQISLPIPNLKLPEFNKDMYKATLDVNQMIYDGSITKDQKTIEQLSLKADQQNLEVELNKIKENVNQIYFNILLSRENEQIIINAQDEIISKLSETDVAVRNEAILQNNEDVLKAELIKSDEQLIEIRAGKEAALNMLSEFLNKKIEAGTVFILPQPDFAANTTENVRPEMELFDLQMNRLDATKKLSTSKLLPKISVFGQAGYGRPGLNMLDPDFKDWYLVGAKISWNIWNWNLSKNEKKITDIQKEIIVSQKETFDKNVKISEQKDLADIRKYDELLKKDEEIASLRMKIANTTSVQYDNGVITAADYTTALNDLKQAQMNLQLHKIQRQMAVLSYLFNSGKQ